MQVRKTSLTMKQAVSNSTLHFLMNTNQVVGPRTDVSPRAYALFISQCPAADDMLQPGSQRYLAPGSDDSDFVVWSQQAVSGPNTGIWVTLVDSMSKVLQIRGQQSKRVQHGMCSIA